MKLDPRFLKGVETLGKGQVEPTRQMATDGHTTLLVVAIRSEAETVRTINKAQAKVLLKEGLTETKAEHLSTDTTIQAAMLDNMEAKFEGAPEARFVVDWDLLSKAVKSLGHDAKSRRQIICDLHYHGGVAYYRLMLKGASDAVAYVAGAIEQGQLDNQGEDK